MLQALSKRMHFGKFIAEAKFQAETARYSELILANDAAGIMDALTNLAVEEVRSPHSQVHTNNSQTTDAHHRASCRKCSSA